MSVRKKGIKEKRTFPDTFPYPSKSKTNKDETEDVDRYTSVHKVPSQDFLLEEVRLVALGLPWNLSHGLLHRGDLNRTFLLALTVHAGRILVLLHSTQGWSTLGPGA